MVTRFVIKSLCLARFILHSFLHFAYNIKLLHASFRHRIANFSEAGRQSLVQAAFTRVYGTLNAIECSTSKQSGPRFRS